MKLNKLTISEIKKELELMDDETVIHQSFSDDQRKGVINLVQRRIKQLEKMRQAKSDYDNRLIYERQYAGKIIAGIDEVGRGPLAGPVIACAVIINTEDYFEGLNDSKQVSKSNREMLYKALTSRTTYAVGSASVEEIDQYNIYEATKIAMKRAVDNLAIQPEVLLIDAMKLDSGLIEESLIKGDSRSISIAAASVIAKVYRDQLMEDYASLYPGYDFEHNAGYGTKKHLEGIEAYGITEIHRKSFEPIKSFVQKV